MSDYTNKIINFFSKKHNSLRRRKELSDYAMSEKEYLNDFLKYEVSFLKKLRIRDFHTADYDGTGSYDFHFSVESVDVSIGSGYYEDSLYEETVKININITPGGTVDVYNEYADIVETLEITDSLISNHDYGWEISNEVIDVIDKVITSNLPDLVTNTRLFQIVEFIIIFPD